MLFICAAFVNQSQAQQKDEIQAESDAFVYDGNAVLDENFTEAEKYYRRAISKKATNAKSSYNLGSAYYAAEFYDEALSKLIESTEHGNKKEKHAESKKPLLNVAKCTHFSSQLVLTFT